MEIIEAIFSMVKQHGVLALVTAFLLWRNWKQELWMQKKVSYLEDEINGSLIELVQDCTQVIERNTAVMARLENRLDTR